MQEERDVEGVTFSLLCCHVRGPLWASDLRPLTFDECDNEVRGLGLGVEEWGVRGEG